MASGQGAQAQRHIRSIHRNLRLLEELLRDMEAQAPEHRPQDARSELLEQVHVAGALEQRRLFWLLDQRSISHTWIGAQVGAEYLELWQAADGRTWYRVTERAIRDLRLGQLASSANVPSNTPDGDTAVSAFPVFLEFGEDWNSDEDSVYDGL